MYWGLYLIPRKRSNSFITLVKLIFEDHSVSPQFVFFQARFVNVYFLFVDSVTNVRYRHTLADIVIL